MPQEVFLPRTTKNKGTLSAGTRGKYPEAAAVAARAKEGRMGTRDAGRGDYNSQKAERGGDPSSFPPARRSRRRTHREEIPLRSFPELPPTPWRCLSILRSASSAELLPCSALLRRAWLFGFVWLHPSSGSSLCQNSFRSAWLRPPHSVQPGLRRGGAAEDAAEEGEASAHLRHRPGKRCPATNPSCVPGAEGRTREPPGTWFCPSFEP